MFRSRSHQSLKTHDHPEAVHMPLVDENKEHPRRSQNGHNFRKGILITVGVVGFLGVLVLVAFLGVLAGARWLSQGGTKASGGAASPSFVKGVDPNRPQYHVMPISGWLNDPNGLIYYEGMYHTFFQYNPYEPHWNWTLHWGHAASPDLVSWVHLPYALQPSKHGADCAGCWSGGMTIAKDGTPTAVYTGVTKTNTTCYIPEIQRNWQYNDGGYRETVMFAQPNMDENSDMLMTWPVNNQGILIPGPPEGMRLNGWRDPFVYQRGGIKETDGDYILLLGTGRMNEQMTESYGGAIMIYTSPDITNDAIWSYHGFMFEGTPDDAIMWECPWMVEVTPAVGNSSHTHVLAVGGSLWVNTHPLEPNNPIIYWLGTFDEQAFKFTTPFKHQKLDIGPQFYASNRMIDGNGRVLVWGWLIECASTTDPNCAHHDYAGSLSMPRVLRVEGDTVLQEVPEEMMQLRNERVWEAAWRTVNPQEQFAAFEGVYHHYEVMVTIQRDSSEAVGLVLARTGLSMLFMYNWQTTYLESYKNTYNELMAIYPGSTADVEALGGPLQNMSGVEKLTLRIFIDGSAVEVFTSTGQVLSTRLYFDEAFAQPMESIKLLSYGGSSTLVAGSAWTMKSFWESEHSTEIAARALKAFPSF